MKYFIGEGYDIHNLLKNTSPDNKITLGGYKFESEYSVEAHSDGDVILHSISNAILGSIQMGDIGEHFPDSDLKIKGISSRKIIDFCLSQLNIKKLKLVNVDLTIICEHVYLMKHKKNIKKELEKILQTEHVNVKATRFEDKTNKQIAAKSIVLVKEDKEC